MNPKPAAGEGAAGSAPAVALSAILVIVPFLLWVLYRNVYPVPEFPNNLWPYVALAWVAASWGLMKLRPAVARAPLPDYS
jgi:hypothetical protein